MEESRWYKRFREHDDVAKDRLKWRALYSRES